MVSRRPQHQNVGFLAPIVAKLTPKWFILILFIKSYLLVPKQSLYDFVMESYDQNFVKKLLRRGQNGQIRVFGAFYALISSQIDSKVFYSNSNHQNLSFGTKNKPLWPYSENLWPKLGQNFTPKARPEEVFEIFGHQKFIKIP